ncbi:MAG: EamA family transporter [Waddliaceae bacterium]|nr:EamA family transporter [Waddliaceae bacterium]
MPLVFLLYALIASVFTIGKNVLNYADPFFIIGVRMFIAGTLILGYQFWRHRDSFKFNKKHWIDILILATVNIFITNVCEFWALNHLSSAKTCLLYSTSPFISVLLSYVILSEKMSPIKWLGLLIGFIGFFPILMMQSAGEETAFLFFSWPELAMIVAATTSVYGWILLRKLVTKSDISFMIANGYSMLFGGIMTLGYSGIIETWDPFPVTSWWPFIQNSLALLLISNLICYNLYGFLLKRYTATFMAFAGLSTPLFAALFGWAFLGEHIPWQFWLSLTIISCGLSIFHRQEVKSVHLTEGA